ncbi:MAG: hypothetical protein JWP63_6019 [Candidatus Solibacter sp.]|nr:hypothetical protein [Candidatus Solibacter sp.]
MKTLLAVLLVFAAHAHDHPVPTKPTKAQGDLDEARRTLAAAKRAIAAQGRYSCCTKPSCDLCARMNGSCNCAENVKNGRGSCGECYAAWRSGRGGVKGVDAKSVPLLPAEHQACAMPAHAAHPVEQLKVSAESLLRAKRTLVGEGRYACCIRGGCGECAHETSCPCGGDLAAHKGVCGECLDGWRSGRGAFAGIDPNEVTLAVFGGWALGASGQFFGVYTDQTGPRGRDKIFSTNWVMMSAAHRAGPGTITFRSMLSAEPATITGKRYPLLLATGETANGVPIINGQHPHDLFMELSALYRIVIGERTSIQLSGGPRGEPALGPPAYPHRASASENPVAPISHHMQDSTHIATNVITAGITHGPVTWEVSGFHGREPDELRWGIEGGAPDSLSTRLTVNPTSRWSGQFSIGRLNRVEATHPLRPMLKETASLSYTRPLFAGSWASTAIWGRNNELAYTQQPNLPVLPRSGIRPLHIVSVPTRVPNQVYNSYLLESTLHAGRNWFWGRAENADKDSTLFYEESPFVLLIDERRLGRVQAYTAGYERDLTRYAGVGGQFTLNHVPPMLAPIYDANPLGVQLFFRLRFRR